MYPGTIFNWYDLSEIGQLPDIPEEYSPLFLTASSFDKGPEDMRVVRGNEFYRLYGTNPDFDKHGQPAIQAANIIAAGGQLLVKRVVASDATLANTILVATVNTKLKAVPTDGEGMTLNEIMELDTSEDTEETQRYTVEPLSTFKWTAVSVAGANNYGPVLEQAESLFVEGEYEATPILGDGEEGGESGGESGGEGEGGDTPTPTPGTSYMITRTADYPMFVIVDNGRGASNKAVRITPDYNTSRSMANFFYNVFVYEGTSVTDSISATMNPDTAINGVNYGFDENSSVQVKFYNVPGAFNAFVNALVKATATPLETVLTWDIVYMKNTRRVNVPGITLEEDSIDLNSKYGIELTNGTNGSFGDAPFGTDEYKNQLIDFFSGSFDDSIFDLDDYKIAAVFDANYPVDVKDQIAELVSFREDCMFFRDLGIDVKSYASIVEAQNNFKVYNRYVADYLTNYQIYNPNNGKRITVTSMYDFSAFMVQHFKNGPFKPTAGVANNAVLVSAIPGTINFTPRITPSINQKALLEDLRINYAIFQEGRCVMQSLYTSQEPYTQLSYVNNVLAIQQVARAVRTTCPKMRWTFASGNDFSEYASAVSMVLSNYTNNFAELTFEYEQNAVYAAQKIFYAVLRFRFNNWAQTEVFDLYALPTEITT